MGASDTSLSGLSRLLFWAPVIGAATVVRTGREWADVATKQWPGLIDLGLESWKADAASGEARLKLRERLIEVGNETATRSADQVLAGFKDLDDFTRPSARGQSTER
jgi:hypothetical protein